MMYAVWVSTTRVTKDNYTVTTQSPTFFLDSTVQGIVSEAHAEKIARHMFEDMGVTVSAISVIEFHSLHNNTNACNRREA